MNTNPPTSPASFPDDSSATYLIRWRGRQEGPYTAAVIEAKLAANQIGLLHEIAHEGQWVTLRDYFAERAFLLRAEREAREEEERRARAEAERQAREREEQRRAEASAREQHKEPAATPLPMSPSQSSSLAAIQKLLIRTFFVVSLLAFFLPNATISLPIFGEISVSMFDFVSPKPEVATLDNSKKTPPQPTVQDFSSLQVSKATTGGIICAIAVIGLMLHYLLTVVWAALVFGLHRTIDSLTTIWLILALQFPILLSIGVHLAMTGIKSDVAKEAAADEAGGFAAVIGAAMLNNTSITPGLAMWALMALALAIFGIRYYQNQLNEKPSSTNYGTIPNQP